MYPGPTCSSTVLSNAVAFAMMPTNSSDVEKAPKKRGTKKKAAPKPPLQNLANVGETTTGEDGEEREEKPEEWLGTNQNTPCFHTLDTWHNDDSF